MVDFKGVARPEAASRTGLAPRGANQKLNAGDHVTELERLCVWGPTWAVNGSLDGRPQLALLNGELGGSDHGKGQRQRSGCSGTSG
jgi:hypothetical protein